MADDEVVRVFVEIPKGSRNKYELNQETGEIELDRRLFAAVSYQHFFESYSDLEGKDWTVEGWGSRTDALAEIAKARERFRADGA